jgi:hypothetical protein
VRHAHRAEHALRHEFVERHLRHARHDHRRETFALFEYGKAEILLGKLEDGLATLDGVLQIIAEDEPKDFEFILDIETRMVVVMRALGRIEEANEVERRLVAVREALGDEGTEKI